MKQFEYGHYVLFNPGEVTTSQILSYYQIERENIVRGENRTSISSFPGFTKIENYFIDKGDAKINLYLPTYHRLDKTQTSLESIISGAKLSKYDV